MEHKLFHRRNLPHLHPSEGIFFITYRLAGSLPVEAIKRLKKELSDAKSKNSNDKKAKGFFKKYDELLDKNSFGPKYLSQPEIAEINKTALHFYNEKEYDIICYCIMPNHIHLVFSLKECSRDVSKIMQSIKRYTSRESNKVLNREGKFWQDESFDRLVRNYKELLAIVNYVINNPVKAGLVQKWEDWPWSFCNFDYL